MLPETSHTMRLRPEQKREIGQAKQIRSTAAALRARVAQGSYDDEELEDFWVLADFAGVTLMVSNPELAQRAGLGDNFFATVTRDRRRPKLTNFLRALTAIIEVADERLHDVEIASRASIAANSDLKASETRIEQDQSELLELAKSLSRVARDEITRLDNERPNDPVTIASNAKQRELLVLFADGFERIASALTSLASDPHEPLLLGKASIVVNNLGAQITEWWKKNGSDAIDWSMRIPVFTAGVAMLGWAGANMTVATTAIAAIVGGKKVMDTLRKKRKAK